MPPFTHQGEHIFLFTAVISNFGITVRDVSLQETSPAEDNKWLFHELSSMPSERSGKYDSR